MKVKIEENKIEIGTKVEAEGIYSRKVTPFGNGAKIDFVKRYIGRDVIVVVLKK
ncbi:MAG: DUF2080 family transposase-associated protein [Candidatus Nanoarchaeia archaeon]|nr:DUF2080 family transposase-associated protein [Candidatus Nanoarchaeia archaeon]